METLRARTTQNPRIGILAPSSKIPQIELRMGVARIREFGFVVDVHPQCRKSDLFFAGTDQERAESFFDYALSAEHSILWCARGGHGAIRLLPLLDELEKSRGRPQSKLLVGYSDATALMEYVRQRWGWSTLHAPMPSLRKFSLLPERDLNTLASWLHQEATVPRWEKKNLIYWTDPPQKSLRAELVGGNLTVWNCLLGTRYEPRAAGRILFFEDVDEHLYRIDRMLHQLALTKSIQGVQAVVLGSFLNCKDYSPMVLKAMPSLKAKKRILVSPKPSELKPLRRSWSEVQGLRQIFTEWGKKLKIPVAFGLPIGHGPDFAPLPLGAEFSLTPEGEFRLEKWDWLAST